MKPNYNHIELMATILWDVLEEDEPESKPDLRKSIVKAKSRYVAKRELTGCSGHPHDYLMRAEKVILEYNFSYDEALQIPNIEYGYNPYTGKWDGKYEGCKIGRKRGA